MKDSQSVSIIMITFVW